MAEQRIKVRTADLIKVVEKQQETGKAQHQKALAEYEKKRVAYDQRVVDVLKRAAESAEKGILPKQWARSLEIPVGMDVPQKPTYDPKRVGADLNLLRLSAEEFVLVGTDSKWSAYLR